MKAIRVVPLERIGYYGKHTYFVLIQNKIIKLNEN